MKFTADKVYLPENGLKENIVITCDDNGVIIDLTEKSKIKRSCPKCGRDKGRE